MLRDPYFLIPFTIMVAIALISHNRDVIFPLPGFGNKVIARVEKADPEDITVTELSKAQLRKLYKASEGVAVTTPGMGERDALLCYWSIYSATFSGEFWANTNQSIGEIRRLGHTYREVRKDYDRSGPDGPVCRKFLRSRNEVVVDWLVKRANRCREEYHDLHPHSKRYCRKLVGVYTIKPPR